MSATTGIYCCDDITGSAAADTVTTLKGSGFTTVIVFAIHVDYDSSTGNIAIRLNGEPGQASANLVTYIASSGTATYVGDPDWPGTLASLKTGTTSVNRILLCLGGWGTSDFQNIQTILTASGGKAALTTTFATLHSGIGCVDGIDFDDESLYSVDTNVALAGVLNQAGFTTVTMCPYTEIYTWIQTIIDINTEYPGFVSGINLQCYAGGAGNEPKTWVAKLYSRQAVLGQSPTPFYPGVAFCLSSDASCGDGTTCSCKDYNCPAAVTSWYQAIQANAGHGSITVPRYTGGFLWRYDDVAQCGASPNCKAACGQVVTVAELANAMISGLNTQPGTQP